MAKIDALKQAVGQRQADEYATPSAFLSKDRKGNPDGKVVAFVNIRNFGKSRGLSPAKILEIIENQDALIEAALAAAELAADPSTLQRLMTEERGTTAVSPAAPQPTNDKLARLAALSKASG